MALEILTQIKTDKQAQGDMLLHLRVHADTHRTKHRYTAEDTLTHSERHTDAQQKTHTHRVRHTHTHACCLSANNRFTNLNTNNPEAAAGSTSHCFPINCDYITKSSEGLRLRYCSWQWQLTVA